MNIKEAKQQIKNAITAYLSRDALGEYEIPLGQQRPVFLLGAPGIGKTAIMSQIAQELGIGLVAYSMTHHTRQSALGLPQLSTREYGGRAVTVTQYTMSEIIAAVYDTMERTGVREGILFLDEINCVSETLMPSMLQFLQFKTFGQHRVPDGWIIVTAGNPPAYNRSVREFDVVTLDRLKRIVVEPDYDVWKEYALARQVHPAVLTYLDVRKDNFYRVESSVSGKQFVTARGWEDLSRMLRVCEKHGLSVDENLIGQYLQSDRICADFSTYYALFQKYSADYAIEDILAGNAPEAVIERARAARFDERYALLGLLIDRMTGELRRALLMQDALGGVLSALKAVKSALEQGDALSLLQEQARTLAAQLKSASEAGALSADRRAALQQTAALLREMEPLCAGKSAGEAYAALCGDFARRLDAHRTDVRRAGDALEHLFAFCERAFAGGQEMLILVTELTVSPFGARFISLFGCEAYFAHNRDLLFYERRKEIAGQLDALDLSAL